MKSVNAILSLLSNTTHAVVHRTNWIRVCSADYKDIKSSAFMAERHGRLLQKAEFGPKLLDELKDMREIIISYAMYHFP